jgi:hypothetical protein
MTTKKDLITKCRKILYKDYINSQDTEFLKYILKNHNDYEQKIGKGIKYFFTKTNHWNNKCFFIKRIDETETDFSFMKSINPPTKINEIKQACRQAISNDIIKLKKQNQNLIAHHVVSFNNIFNDWIKTQNINKIEIIPTQDNNEITEFANENIKNNFIKFHNSLAIIKFVTKEEHKNIHKKQNGNS